MVGSSSSIVKIPVGSLRVLANAEVNRLGLADNQGLHLESDEYEIHVELDWNEDPGRAHRAESGGAQGVVGADYNDPSKKPPPVPVQSALKPAEIDASWPESFFDENYIRTLNPPDPAFLVQECDFILTSLAARSGARILDVGCGLGLHAIECASRGLDVTAVDLSLPSLSKAAHFANQLGQNVHFLQQDMRMLEHVGTVDLLMCWGGTFGVYDDAANLSILRGFVEVLKRGGRFVLDINNREHVQRFLPQLRWFEGDGYMCMEEADVPGLNARLRVRRTLVLRNGSELQREADLRLYSVHEVLDLVRSVGLVPLQVSGQIATPGVFLGASSPRIIVVCQKL